MESKSTFDPPLRGEKEGTAVIEAKWTGPCKPTQKPGDLILPSGGKINVATQEKSPEPAPAPAPKKGMQRGSGGAYVPAADPASAARNPAVPPTGTTAK